MTYTVDDLARDCRAALKADAGKGGREKVRDLVSAALRRPGFAAEYLDDPEAPERKVVYEDPELKFCICAHVHTGGAMGDPHDHGPTWAVYGQAAGVTRMTDWEVAEPPKGGAPGKVRQTRAYQLVPGDAHLYEPGDVHAPLRDGPTKLIRIEGLDTMTVRRTPLEAIE